MAMRSIYKDAADRFNKGEITHTQFLEECRKISMANPPIKNAFQAQKRTLGDNRSRKKIAEENQQAEADFWAALMKQTEIVDNNDPPPAAA